MRRGAATLACGSAAIAAILAASFNAFSPRLIYNPSPSAPMGFYLIERKTPFKTGDRVAAFAPEWARELADERGYLPGDLPVIKQVWAMAGDEICAENRVLFAPGQSPIQARDSDSLGREMPVWTGCRILHQGEYLLISNDVQGSFDGRYFGPVTDDEILGRARLVWRY